MFRNGKVEYMLFSFKQYSDAIRSLVARKAKKGSVKMLKHLKIKTEHSEHIFGRESFPLATQYNSGVVYRRG